MSGYVAAQRGGNLSQQGQLPNSIQSNLPPEYFNQQPILPNMFYNNLPTQIPMSIPLDVPAQQLTLEYPSNMTSSVSRPTSPIQKPYFPPGYVPADENDKKGKVRIARKLIK